MIRKLSIFVFLLSTLCAASASAHWQYTQWDMTVEQVQAASAGKAFPLTPQEQISNSAKDANEIALLEAPYASGQYQFTTIFSFNKITGKLSSVKLKLNNPSAKAVELLGSLRTKYGNPESEKLGAALSYAIWYQDGEQISYLSIGDTLVSVSYKPRNSSDNEGL